MRNPRGRGRWLCSLVLGPLVLWAEVEGSQQIRADLLAGAFHTSLLKTRVCYPFECSQNLSASGTYSYIST